MITSLEAFNGLVASGDLEVIESFDVPPRAERLLPISRYYLDGSLNAWLRDKFSSDGLLWSHQALALERLERGSNVVISTGTASGKSLVFQLASAREILDGDGNTLVLYPLKALLADQANRWRRLASELGLPGSTVAELHGDILPDERLEAVRSARIVVATPDTIHAWMMRQVATPLIRDFLSSLRFLILDEAHIYESVFGSNVAYLLRRFLAARRRACQGKRSERPLQIIGATATIADPARHLEALTGWPFVVVGEADDGSPSYGRTLLHLNGPDHGHAAETMIVDVCGRLVRAAETGSFITFHDSRQGVERVAAAIDNDDVLPYRSGYESTDRKLIESRLHAGHLRGVISTPALELGIDVSNFLVGLNVGVPQSKKAFRQRLGRVGRTSSGAFAVIAPRHAFTRFGSTFSDYYLGSVEPSHLYLQNRFIQFAQARCLLDESEGLGTDTKGLPPGVVWPDTFPAIFEMAKPGVRRSREYDFIAQLGADSPHFNYALRQIGEPNYVLKNKSGVSEDIGHIALNQAIREAYPGATYLHFRKPMRVLEWRSSSYDRSIRIEIARSSPPTRPMLRKTVNVGFGSDEIVAGRIKSNATGLLAEVFMQVNESVEGYRIGSSVFSYKDLRQQNPHMTRKQREFRTTGIVIKIEEDWFSGSGGPQAQARTLIAEALTDLLMRERSVSPNDVDHASTHIAIYQNGAPRRATDTVVIYDSIYGGLRLTEALFDELPEYLTRLHRAAELSGDQAALSSVLAGKLRAWAFNLTQGTPTPDRTLTPPDGELIVYSPGSVVSIMQNGTLLERALVAPQLLPFGGSEMLVYSYDTGGRGMGMVPHDQVQQTGQDWSFSFWNPKTGEMRAIEQEEGSF